MPGRMWTEPQVCYICCSSSSSPSSSPFILDCLVAFEFGFLYQLGSRIVEGIETMSPLFHTEKQTPLNKTVQSVKQDPSKIPLKSKPKYYSFLVSNTNIECEVVYE